MAGRFCLPCPACWDTSEADVETALALLLEQQVAPTFDRVRDLVRDPTPLSVPELMPPVLDFALYDDLLTAEVAS